MFFPVKRIALNPCLKCTVEIKLDLMLMYCIYRAQLVPVFSFGENELFDQMTNPTGSPLRWLQDHLQRLMGVALPLFTGRGVFQYSFGLLPYRQPIHTVVGRPIPVVQTPSPTKDDIQCLHSLYLEGLTTVFEDNKDNYGIAPDKHLHFI
uniref:Monoacylglycerol O-acyltransferase 3a n=1 Tax=Hucho hucho TaxID=62062 RepID=A0A4W5NES0_9TELE